MSTIKTKEAVEKGIKTLDKAADISARAKAAYIRTKQSTKRSTEPASPSDESINSYTTGKAEHTINEATHQVGSIVRGAAERGVQIGRKYAASEPENGETFRTDTVDSSPNAYRENTFRSSRAEPGQYREHQKQRAERNSGPPSERGGRHNISGNGAVGTKVPNDYGYAGRSPSYSPVRDTVSAAQKHTRSTMDNTAKAARQASEHTVRAAVRTSERTVQAPVKTEQTSKMAVKTSQAAAKAAETAARAAARAARAAARAAAETAKVTAKAIAAAAKAIAAAIKGLVALISAGGWVAVVVIVVLCIIGLIAASCYGIFFSDSSDSAEMSIKTAVRQIDAQYQADIDRIISENQHDHLEMSGSRAPWPEVLAVYSVLLTTNTDEPQDAATMDDGKLTILMQVYRDANSIDYRVEEATLDRESEDADSESETEVWLYITVSHRTPDEMAELYSFSEEQIELLHDLLSDEFSELWAGLLYGADTDAIVATALSQVGNVGGEPYWSWYGFEYRVDWCACFVSWCANECGYIDSGAMPMFALCTDGESWFKARGRWQDGGYTPSPGDIIFFDWTDETGSGDGYPDHVGIVTDVSESVVYTVEGNSYGDECRAKQYPLNGNEIYGYGVK